MKIARVFPRRTKMTPNDDNAYVGLPPLWCPQYDEIHVSVTFTWDILRAKQLAKEWSRYGDVKLGGPALGDMGNEFTPSMYIRKGVVFTSRGCPNNCWYCFVPKREGKIRTLPITEGNIIQDNNLLACPKDHIRAVFEMLKTQKHIEFSGGLQADLVSEWIAGQLFDVNYMASIRHIWLSYDRCGDEGKIRQAVKNLRDEGFQRCQIRCYVLIGFEGDTLTKAEARLKKAWQIGTLPFAMRFRYSSIDFKNSFVYTDRAWNLLTRQWSRPAIIKAMMKAK